MILVTLMQSEKNEKDISLLTTTKIKILYSAYYPSFTY